MWGPRRGSTVVAPAVVLGLAIVVAALSPAGVAAGDALAIYEPEPQTVAASPGETVTVDVAMRSDGGYGGEGIGSYRFVFAVPPDVLAIESVEPGPYLAGGGEHSEGVGPSSERSSDGGTVEHAETRVEDGAVLVEQERVGADDGQTGYAVAATVTLRVRENASAANATVRIADPATHLAGDTALQIKSLTEDGTVVVDGGGERVAPAYDAGTADAGDVGVTTAADVNRTVATDGGAQQAGTTDGGSQEDDRVPGFGFVATIAGTLIATLLAAQSVRAQRRTS